MEEPLAPASDQQQWALNLCDIVPWHTLMASGQPATTLEWVLSSCQAASVNAKYDRLYVGSYFCEHYFCGLTPAVVSFLQDFASAHNLALTLVVPVVSQGMLERVRSLVQQLVFPAESHPGVVPFDEIVVNDYGMAQFLHAPLTERCADSAAPARLIRGRLLARCVRDPRYPVFDEEPQPYPLDAEQAENAATTWGISATECDPFAPKISALPLENRLPLHLHAPHAYMSTGHICEYAAERKTPDQKFRASAACAQECLGSIRVHEVHTHAAVAARAAGVAEAEDAPNTETNMPVAAPGSADSKSGAATSERITYLTKMGRSIFFENPRAEIVGQQPERIIWTPSDFLCGRGTESWW